ncbi:hypothetical protein [Metamycoplasma auris]|nr:hypothetical protein [Metamycoplasma auris]
MFDSNFLKSLEKEIKEELKNPKSEYELQNKLRSLYENLDVLPINISNYIEKLHAGVDANKQETIVFIKNPKLRSNLLILMYWNQMIKKHSIFKTKTFDVNKISLLLPHFKRTNNASLNQYLTLYTFEKMARYLLDSLKEFSSYDGVYSDKDDIEKEDFFNSSGFYDFFIDFVKTYKTQSGLFKKYIDHFTFYKEANKDWWFRTVSDMLKNGYFNGEFEIPKLDQFFKEINASDYLSSKNNLFSSLSALSHYILLHSLNNKDITTEFIFHDFKLLQSTFLDFLPWWNWNNLANLDTKSLFYDLELKTRESSYKEVNKLTKTEIDKILNYPPTNLPKSLQEPFNNLLKEIARHLKYKVEPSNSNKWIGVSHAMLLANLKDLISKAKNIIKIANSNGNTKLNEDKRKEAIELIKPEVEEWNKYISSIKPVVERIKNNKNLLATIELIENLYNKLNQKYISDISKWQHTYNEYIRIKEKYDSLVKSIDIFNKAIKVTNLKSPEVHFLINNLYITKFNLEDNYHNFLINDIDLYNLKPSALAFYIQAPYKGLFKISNIKLNPSNDGTKSTLDFEVSLSNHPTLKNQLIKRRFSLNASSEKIEIYNKIKKKQATIDKWLNDQKITKEKINTELQFLKEDFNKYELYKINIFDNSKDKSYYTNILKVISDFENTFKTKYAEYLEKLKKQLIGQFNSQYDKFISTIDSLTAKKYKDLVSEYKSKSIQYAKKIYNAYSKKTELIKSMSIADNDFKKVSIADMKSYVSILTSWNKQLRIDIDEINKLFDISDLDLDIVLANNLTHEDWIRAFAKKIPFEVKENIDFSFELKKSVPGIKGFVKFKAKKTKKIVGELEIELPFIRKDISKLDLRLRITNKTKEELIIKRLIQVLGFEIKKYQDYEISIRKATKKASGEVWIKGFGQKIYGSLYIPITQLKLDDISSLELNLDLTKDITEDMITEALIEKLRFKVIKNKDFRVSITPATKENIGIIKITALDTKITGELLIYIPKKNLPIDLSKLKLDIEKEITKYTPTSEIIASFNKALGWNPRYDINYGILTSESHFSLDGFARIFSKNNKMFINSLHLAYNRPKPIDISKLKSQWTLRLTQNTDINDMLDEFINLLRTPYFVPRKDIDFSYSTRFPVKQNDHGQIKFVANRFSALQGELILKIDFVEETKKPIEKDPKPSIPTIPKPKEKNDTNLNIKIIAGVLTSLVFLGVIIAIAAVFIKTHKNHIKIELQEENDE